MFTFSKINEKKIKTKKENKKKFLCTYGQYEIILFMSISKLFDVPCICCLFAYSTFSYGLNPAKS